MDAKQQAWQAVYHANVNLEVARIAADRYARREFWMRVALGVAGSGVVAAELVAWDPVAWRVAGVLLGLAVVVRELLDYGGSARRCAEMAADFRRNDRILRDVAHRAEAGEPDWEARLRDAQALVEDTERRYAGFPPFDGELLGVAERRVRAEWEVGQG